MLSKTRHEFRSILDSTAGIVFVSCLHDEADPEFEELCLKCAATELGLHVKHRVVASLKNDEHWSAVKEVMESFRSLSSLNPPISVRALFELKNTSYNPTPFPFSRKKEVVSGYREFIFVYASHLA